MLTDSLTPIVSSKRRVPVLGLARCGIYLGQLLLRMSMLRFEADGANAARDSLLERHATRQFTRRGHYVTQVCWRESM